MLTSTPLDELQTRLGVQFPPESHLQQALTHRSAAEAPLGSNERLEFLGDSVISLFICERLLELFPTSSEGDLAKARAYIVSEPILAVAADTLGLDEFLVFSAGETASGNKLPKSLLADVFEAIVGAIYVDIGIPAARAFVLRALDGAIETVVADDHHRDYKSSLQEQTQAAQHVTPVYRIVTEEGKDHDKTFTAQALVGEQVIGLGAGKSKKEAEQAAAKNALDGLSMSQAQGVDPI